MARERWRRGYRRNAERIRQEKLSAHYRKRYGLTLADLRRMREERDNRCDICRRPAGEGSKVEGRNGRLHVDHCHTTGRVRGLLCGHCNTMIGLAREDPAILMAAVRYLEG